MSLQPARSPRAGPDRLLMEDEQQQVLADILASQTFRKAHRLAELLQFICVKAMEGRPDELTEQQIGIHVFGRAPSYSPAEDSIVRSQVRLLRQRLEEYFETESPATAYIIKIPKGGYQPVYVQRGPIFATGEAAARSPEAPQALSPVLPHLQEKKPQPAVPRLRRYMYPVLVLLAAAGIGVALRERPVSSRFWSTLFDAGRPVVIVPSDDGLVLSEEMARMPVSLDQYLKGAYLRQPSLNQDWLAAHQYTSTADLNLAMRLSRLPEAAHAQVETRYARVLRLDDLKNSNVILIGGLAANPWVSLFSRRLSFEVNYDWQNEQGYVLDQRAPAGKQSRYLEARGHGQETSYGVLAYLPAISGEGKALLFEGSGMAGTEAAAEFPFSGARFTQFLHGLGVDGSGEIPAFEILLETRSLEGNAPESTVVLWRKLAARP